MALDYSKQRRTHSQACIWSSTSAPDCDLCAAILAARTSTDSQISQPAKGPETMTADSQISQDAQTSTEQDSYQDAYNARIAEQDAKTRGYDALVALLGRRDSKKLANNTYAVRLGPDQIAVRFHSTDVLTYTRYADGSTLLRINTGSAPGWYTVSTLERINAYAPRGVQISAQTQSRRDAQKNGYARDYDEVAEQLEASGWYRPGYSAGSTTHFERAVDRAARQRWTLTLPDGSSQPFNVAADVAL